MSRTVAAADVAVRCNDLSVARAGDAARVVDGVSFSVAPGGALAVMGPTGAGKSSLLAVLAGAADSALAVVGGSAEVDGVSVKARGRLLRRLRFVTAYLPQRAGADLPARLTVGEVIGEPIASRDKRVSQRALAVRVAGLLDELQLPLGAAQKYPYELSAGMRQRVALARAFLLHPRVFIGDEPYANLDLEVRQVARDALLRRRAEEAMAVIMVTNDAEAVREMDADVLVLRGGHPVGIGHGIDDVLWTPGRSAPLAS